MTSCRESTDLSSLRLDQRLSPRQWFKWSLHNVVCPFCKRFGQQISILHNFCNRFGETAHEGQALPGLSDEARERIKQQLRGKI